jgi:hypothetical protein
MGLQQIPSKGGIPSGNTASRPGSPVIGDTYYDGTLGFLFIFDGTNFIPCSAPASQPTIAVTDVGTGIAYGTVQASVAFTEGASGGKAAGFTATQSAQSVTQSSSPIVLTITGNPGSYSFGGTAFNAFGTSPAANTVSQTLTSVPQAPTIGTTTLSAANAIVNWTLNSNGGKALTAITITPYLNGTTAQTPVNAATTSSTSHTVTGLTQGSSYTFKVKTTNANGVSLESSASNSVTIPITYSMETLVIAGGGAGGSPMGGGGGAGGLVYTSSAAFEQGISYTVTVGAGAAQTSESSVAAQGSPSNITGTGLSLTQAVGGGGGGKWSNNTSSTGGSGGGGQPNGGGSAGTSGQGFAGGTGSVSSINYRAGGGGGSAEAGSTDAVSDGGDGLDTYSAWGAATSTGENSGGTYYYAGGGGGGKFRDNTGTPEDVSVGGLGGGGAGGRGNDGASIVTGAVAGTANTGGGGGGAGVYGGSAGDRVGKAGGSGIVLIRYNGTVTAASTSGSPSRVVSGGYTYYTFTGNGSITF